MPARNTRGDRIGWTVTIVAIVVIVAGWAAFVFMDVSSTSGVPQSMAQDGARERNIDRLRALPYASSVERGLQRETGVIEHDRDRSCPGYSLYCIQFLSRADLIDENGRVVRSWEHHPSKTWENVELMPNGDLLVVGVENGYWPDGRPLDGFADNARYALRMDWDGNVLWKRRIQCHHDITVAPDRQIMALGFQRRHLPQVHPTLPIRDETLLRLDLELNPLDEFSMMDVLMKNASRFPLETVSPTDRAGPPWVDLLHANSVEWMHYPALVGRHAMYDPQNVLVSLRHQDRLVVFDLQTGDLVWSWGEGVVSGPHDAHVLADGHILLFDNGIERNYSRGLEIDPLTGQIVWEYEADPPESFYTLSKGSIQRLPNGNTLLAESDNGRAFEVTSDGEIVWEFYTPHEIAPDRRAAIVRMKRFPVAYVDAIAAMTPAERRGDTAWFDTVVR